MIQANLVRDFITRSIELKVWADIQQGKVAATALISRGAPLLLFVPTQWSRRGSVEVHGQIVESLSCQAVVITRDERHAHAPDLVKHDELRAAVRDAAAYAASQQAGVTVTVGFGRYAYASSVWPEWRETVSVRFIENDDGGTFEVPVD